MAGLKALCKAHHGGQLRTSQAASVSSAIRLIGKLAKPSNSHCGATGELANTEQGLSAQRIYQDLVERWSKGPVEESRDNLT
jgi:hypothetical protein